ncbi:hypothetical protein [Aliiroseovarius pelagivivens]|uniref:hypothetical protein n=1 Tax=Aliiroseovarius pelagivivens TaxID=1639690 RepID=UPI0015E82971|nr:hypothetical protein [Aliiroseovarius pelagivivens]
MSNSIKKLRPFGMRMHASALPTDNCQDHAFAFGSNENKREGNTTREEQQCSN